MFLNPVQCLLGDQIPPSTLPGIHSTLGRQLTLKSKARAFLYPQLKNITFINKALPLSSKIIFHIPFDNETISYNKSHPKKSRLFSILALLEHGMGCQDQARLCEYNDGIIIKVYPQSHLGLYKDLVNIKAFLIQKKKGGEGIVSMHMYMLILLFKHQISPKYQETYFLEVQKSPQSA